MQFSFFSSVEGDCKSPFSQENQVQFSITRKRCLPTSESAQCFIFIPSSNRSGLTPGTPENGTNKTSYYCSIGVRSKDLFFGIHWVNTFYEYRSISFLARQRLEKLAAMILLSAGITSFAIK